MNYIVYSNPRSGSWLTVDHIARTHPDYALSETSGVQNLQPQRPVIAKTHGLGAPISPQEWHMVHVWRQDSFAQFCSAQIAIWTKQYRVYSREADTEPRPIPPRVMLNTVTEFRQYDAAVNSLKTLPWNTVTTLQYEQIIQTPQLLTEITGTTAELLSTPSHRLPYNYITNYKKLRKLYRAKFSDHFII